MENASKALIFAAEVLIGVIILTIGVALFLIFSNYTKSTTQEIERTQILEFNANFLKYQNLENGITAYDIVSIANFANQNNIGYELENENDKNPNTYYVRVDLSGINKMGQAGKINENNFQKNEELKNEFIKYYHFEYEKNNTTGKYEIKQTLDGPKIRAYKISNIDYNSFGRVNYVKITEYT